MIPPLPFTWDGEAMRPLRPRLADEHFVIGEQYVLEEYQERSKTSHDHFFVCVAEAWVNLPEDLMKRWPTPDHLRKWALIKEGFRNERTFVAATKAEALRVAAFLRPMDEYAIITVSGCVVTELTAKTQKKRAMGSKDFQASKEAVLGLLSAMIDTTPAALAENAREAA